MESGGTPRGAEGLLGRAESVQAPSAAKQAAPPPQSAPPPPSAKAPSAVQQQAALLDYIFPSLADNLCRHSSIQPHSQHAIPNHNMFSRRSTLTSHALACDAEDIL